MSFCKTVWFGASYILEYNGGCGGANTTKRKYLAPRASSTQQKHVFIFGMGKRARLHWSCATIERYTINTYLSLHQGDPRVDCSMDTKKKKILRSAPYMQFHWGVKLLENSTSDKTYY